MIACVCCCLGPLDTVTRITPPAIDGTKSANVPAGDTCYDRESTELAVPQFRGAEPPHLVVQRSQHPARGDAGDRQARNPSRRGEHGAGSSPGRPARYFLTDDRYPT